MGSSRLGLVALDHAPAGTELREQLAFADAEIPAVLKRLTDPGSRALARRGADGAPMLLIDRCVPRNIEPVVTELSVIELRRIDGLRGTVERDLMLRR